MKVRVALVLFAFFTFFIAGAQPDTCRLRISLLTCSPGEELYSTFGHTAIRVTDREAGTDMVFNYGTFEFGPDFYMQFVRGKLLYNLSIENFSDFMYSYQLESRSIQEQELQLSCSAAQQLFTALLTNAQPQHRYYRYDFLFDNCTTRARDMIEQQAPAPVQYQNILPQPRPTFRQLLHTYLNKGGQYWSRLGIDILLGAGLDKRVTNHQSMFLPDYLLKGMDKATVQQQPLVAPPQTILQMPSPLQAGSWFRPGVVFTVLLVAVALLGASQADWARTTLAVFDSLFFMLLGLSGLLLLFMWFGTEHVVCSNNYNLLWAWPTHLLAAFTIRKGYSRLPVYFRVAFAGGCLLLLTWPWLPQQLNTDLIPVVLLIILRSWYRSKWNSYAFAKRN